MKKWIFWLIVAVVVVGIALYWKFAGFGDALMSVIIGAVGIVLGWGARWAYEKYILDKK